MTEWGWTGLGILDAAVAVVCAVLWILGERAIPDLRLIPAPHHGRWPRVSIVVAARNEERQIEAGVRSLLQLDYPDLQVTVVNDRSTDGTGAILAQVAAENPRLNVVSINQLPAGWLGKNNAMQAGAAGSDGEWLLFTDADVVFAPDSLKRALAFAEDRSVDHLSVIPQITTPSFWLRAFVPVFSMCFLLYIKAWAIRRRGDSAHVGIGAFNLVRTSAYRSIGGHESLRLRPDDDVKLGKVLKKAGFQADLALAGELVSVEWYAGVGELIRGLEKNTFAVLDYRWPMTVASVSWLLLTMVVPFVTLTFAPSPADVLFAFAAVVYVTFAGRACVANGQPRWLGVLFPVGMTLFAFIQLRTMVLTLVRGGIRWRDTFYPLKELRLNRV